MVFFHQPNLENHPGPRFLAFKTKFCCFIPITPLLACTIYVEVRGGGNTVDTVVLIYRVHSENVLINYHWGNVKFLTQKANTAIALQSFYTLNGRLLGRGPLCPRVIV